MINEFNKNTYSIDEIIWDNFLKNANYFRENRKL